MKVSRFLVVIFFLLCACSSNKTPPNIILISLDTVRFDHLKQSGYERDTMPTLSTLANQCMDYQQHRSNSTYTTPSHMSMLTGLLPGEHKVHLPFGDPREESQAIDRRLAKKIPLISEELSRSGYHTFSAKNSRDYFLDDALGFGRGFAERLPFGLDGKQSVDLVVNAVKDLPAPYFAFIHSKRPHAPYVLPKEYEDLFSDPKYKGQITGSKYKAKGENPYQYLYSELFAGFPGILPDQNIFFLHNRVRSPADLQKFNALYDGALRMTDNYLSTFLGEIRKRSDFKNTILIITSDHGESLYEHQEISHQHPWETVLRVPLLICDEREKVKKSFQIPTQSIDLYPTILSYAGVASNYNGKGTNLKDISANDTHLNDREIISETILNGEPSAIAVIKNKSKVIFKIHKKEFQYFDLNIDQKEQSPQGENKKNDLHKAIRLIVIKRAATAN